MMTSHRLLPTSRFESVSKSEEQIAELSAHMTGIPQEQPSHRRRHPGIPFMPLITLPSTISAELSPAIQAKLASLDPVIQETFLAEFSHQRKSIHTAFWMFCAGLHYLYLGKIAVQLIFWCSFGGFGIWYMIDIFRCRGLIRERNRTVALKVLRDIQILS
jgi:hypothetical protein